MSLKLDRTCSDLGVICLFVSVLDLTLNGDALFLYESVEKRCVTHNNLQCAVHVSQVDERYAAVVSDVLDPAAYAEFLTYVLLGQ